jgi:hypothetical protein
MNSAGIPIHSCGFRRNSGPFLWIPAEFRSIPVDSGGIPEFLRIPADSSRNQWGTEKYCNFGLINLFLDTF